MRITIYCDGACEPCNPSGVGTAAAIAFEGDVSGREGAARPSPLVAKYAEVGRGPGMTNNCAEYKAVRWALRWAVKHYPQDEIVIRTDSQLVVRQINADWRCNSEHLLVLRDECRRLKEQLFNCKIEWVRREENDVADVLTKRAFFEAVKQNPFRRA